MTKTVWMGMDDDIYQPRTANADPREAAREYLDDQDEITVAEFVIGSVADFLPNHLLGRTLESLGDIHCDFPEYTAEGELFNSLYKTATQQELEALLRPALEQWWTKYAAGFGVTAHYRATGKEMTFTAAELRGDKE